jgi:hypothetical protein
MTQAEYARHRGVSEAAVSKALKAQRISLQADGKIDPVAADAQWARNSRVRAGSGKAAAPGVAGDDGAIGGEEPGSDNYWTARSRREQAEAELAEIELAEKQAQVIQVKAVEAVWAQALSSVREHLLQVRARLAPLLAVESDVFKIEQLLDAEHSQALQHLAGVQLRRPEESM